MARLVPIFLLLSLTSIAAEADAAEPSDGAWHVDQRIERSRSFDIPDQLTNVRSGSGLGSRILAGRELMPNGVIGLGMFGQKSEKGPLSAATARDLSLPKHRKAAVGFSLKF